MIDYSQLKRHPDLIKSVISKALPNPEGPAIVTKPLKMLFPQRFVDRDLAFLGNNNQVTAMAALIHGDYYAVLKCCALFNTEPISISRVNYQGREFVEFSYEPGCRLFTTRQLVKMDVLVYRIFDEFINKGNVPWYMNYEDMAGIFDTALKHAGTSLAEAVEVTEMIVSLQARAKGDLVTYFRTQIKTREDLQKIHPAFIGIINAAYSPTNTLGRTTGSFFDMGVEASTVYPTNRIEKMEAIVRA